MKITKLEVEAFKRVKAVRITPDGNAVVIGGANGAGKSSALDAIEAALGGKKHTPEEPIRRGQKKARVVVETDELVVTRTFTAKGSQLEVKAKDGSVYPSPQALLDGLVGELSFDPLTFARQAPKEQAETLRQLVGLDFTILERERQGAYDERTEVGREIKRLQGALDKLPEAPAGAAEVSVAELLAEAERRQKVNAENASTRHALDVLRKRAINAAAEVERLEKLLAAAKADLEAIRSEGKAVAADVAQLVDENLDEIRARIANAEETNRAARAAKERERLQADLDQQIEASEKLTAKITAIDAQKAAAAAAAQYPIEGLAVTEDGVTLGGVPFEQASQAEKLRASVAIGLALNPKLKVLLIRDGALLDAHSLRIVGEMAAAADAQCWIEVVGNRDEVTVLIEDGEVAAPAEPTDSRQPAAGMG